MQTIESVCSICGNPMNVRVPAELEEQGMRQFLVQKIVPLVAHDHCFDYRRSSQQRLEIADLARKRACAWGGICPPIYQDTDLAMVPSRAKSKVLAWEFGEKGLVLHGPTGQGKTRMAYMILRREHLVGRMVVAMTHTEFSRESVRLAMSENQNVASRWVRVLMEAEILFIDDFGKSRFVDLKGNSKHADELLFDILEGRMSHRRPCFFTTNDVGQALEQRMSPTNGPALIRRMRESCIAIAM